MRLPTPKFTYPAEVYEAIIREHQASASQMGEVLMACGWSIGNAAWAAVNWELHTLAAAIAHERDKRKIKVTALPDDEVASLGDQSQAEKKIDAPPLTKTPWLAH